MNEENGLIKSRWLYADDEGVVRVSVDAYGTKEECQEALSRGEEVLMRVPNHSQAQELLPVSNKLTEVIE